MILVVIENTKKIISNYKFIYNIDDWISTNIMFRF